MYTNFRLVNFKCFDSLEINSPARINLIVGANNVGKTALLEALFIFSGAYNPTLPQVTNLLRGLVSARIDLTRTKEAPWETIFRNFEIEQVVELDGNDLATGRRKLRLRGVVSGEELRSIETHGSGIIPNVTFSWSTPGQALQQSGTSTLSAGAAKVLELEFEIQGKLGRIYYILDAGGARTYPPVIPPPPFPAFFLPGRSAISLQEQAERFGNLIVENRQDVVVQALQVIEPRLKKLETVVSSGVPTLYGDVGLARPIPIPLMGGGMSRVIDLMANLGNAPNGVLMVDEIENGLYHAILPKMWAALYNAAEQFNTQIFATTHSMECVRAAHQTFSNQKDYDFRLYRLERSNGAIRLVSYDRDTLDAAIRTELEVR